MRDPKRKRRLQDELDRLEEGQMSDPDEEAAPADADVGRYRLRSAARRAHRELVVREFERYASSVEATVLDVPLGTVEGGGAPLSPPR